MAKQWQNNDLVRFIAGGPVMAVKSFTNPGPRQLQLVVCQWFSKADELQEGQFPAESLTDAAADPSGRDVPIS